MTASEDSPSGGKSGDGVSDAERAAYYLLADRLAEHRQTVRIRSESVMASLDAETFGWHDLEDLYGMQEELAELVAVGELLVEDAPHVEKGRDSYEL